MRNPGRITLAVVAAALCIVPSPAIGQQTPVCWQSHPRASCRAFIVDEFSFASAAYLGDPTRDGSMVYMVGFEIGKMWNRTERNAIGVTAFAMWEFDQRIDAGVRARYRRWLSTSSALDASAGVSIPRVGSLPGVNAKITFLPIDEVGITLGTELLTIKTYEYLGCTSNCEVGIYDIGRKMALRNYLAVSLGSRRGTILALVVGTVAGMGALAVGQQ